MASRVGRADGSLTSGHNQTSQIYKVGEGYLVEDGNHWVSVARYQGVEWIDAEVVEVRSSIPEVERNAVCRVCFDTAA